MGWRVVACWAEITRTIGLDGANFSRWYGCTRRARLRMLALSTHTSHIGWLNGWFRQNNTHVVMRHESTAIVSYMGRTYVTRVERPSQRVRWDCARFPVTLHKNCILEFTSGLYLGISRQWACWTQSIRSFDTFAVASTRYCSTVACPGRVPWAFATCP